MRNPLDTASVAQRLDGERLMGCLHYPGRRIFLAQSGYKDLDLQQDTIIDRKSLFCLPPHSLHHIGDFARVRVNDSYQFFNGEIAVSL